LDATIRIDRVHHSRIAGSLRLRICVFSRLTGVKWALNSLALFVTNPLILPQNCVALAMANPLAGPDHEVAGWFHAHLTRTFVSVLRAFTEFGSSEWIGVVLFLWGLFFFF
jgi:hypothetical protein